MRIRNGLCLLGLSLASTATLAQLRPVQPNILTETDLEGKVTTVQVAPRFVTAIRLPEAVSSVAVGDPSEFQVEHSEHEPRLVFVKTLSLRAAQTNLLISTSTGHEVTLLLISRGDSSSPEGAAVDLLLKYESPAGFFVAPSAFPFAVVGATLLLTEAGGSEDRERKRSTKADDAASLVSSVHGERLSTGSESSREDGQGRSLDQLLEEQEDSPLPTLYGQHVGSGFEKGDHVRTGVSRVIDAGQQVIVLFSVVNPTTHAVLLMPPQIQLGGRTASGKLIRTAKWSTSEQLPVLNFRLNRRRLGPSERADGVVAFERPPYKQSNEALLLQIADSGAVDRPALAPIGFGVTTPEENRDVGRK